MRSVLTVCLLALLLSACGSSTPTDSAEEFSGADKAVAATIEALEETARENDPGRLCTQLLGEKLLATLKQQGTNCTTAVSEAFEDASSKDLTVDDVSINGDNAVAKVTSGTGSNEKTDTLLLEKAGASWKISSLQS